MNTCRSCGFENMRGAETCTRCGARLVWDGVASAADFHPPRATKRQKYLLGMRRAMDRTLGRGTAESASAAAKRYSPIGAWRSLPPDNRIAALLSFVPGLGHLYLGRTRQAAIFFVSWLVVLGGYLDVYPTYRVLVNCALVAVIFFAFLSASQIAHFHPVPEGRFVFCGCVACLLAVGVYYASGVFREGAEEPIWYHVAHDLPLIGLQAGDAITLGQGLGIGDVVLTRTPIGRAIRMRGSNIALGGLYFAVLLGGEGTLLEVSANGTFVNGRPIAGSFTEHLAIPKNINHSVRAGKGQVLVFPVMPIRILDSQDFENATLFRESMVAGRIDYVQRGLFRQMPLDPVDIFAEGAMSYYSGGPP